jgi:hypothetical protein
MFVNGTCSFEGIYQLSHNLWDNFNKTKKMQKMTSLWCFFQFPGGITAIFWINVPICPKQFSTSKKRYKTIGAETRWCPK